MVQALGSEHNFYCLANKQAIRFMQLEQLDVPFESMRETLKGFRDKLIRGEKLERLEALTASQDAPQGYEAGAAMQTLA